LSRNELDKRCQPSGLYGDCSWDEKAIRRLIGDGRIAARVKGEDSPDSSSGCTEECPICFLMYSDINKTTCCHANMCTECFLQVRPQKEKQSTCPFCNSEDFSVVMVKKKEPDSQVECPSETSTSLSDSSSSSITSSSASLKKKSAASVAPHTPKPKAKTTGFGSELEKDERFQRMRKRSESFASSDGTRTPKRDEEMIQSIAMTPEERQRLEEEMKAQHFHPLVLRLESEAQERRLENDRAYQSTASARNQQTFDTSTSRGYHMSRRARERRNWDQLASFFDQGEDMDDMSTLETAILYSRLRDESNSEGGGSSNNNSDREQMDGIPLLRTLLTGQLDGNEGSSRSGRSLNLRSSRRQRNQLMRSGLGSFGMRNRGMGDVALETASMMMRGISEEEQISMAIAASMRDQETAESDEGNDEEESSEVDSSNSGNDSPAEDSSDDSGADSSSSASSSPQPSTAQSSGDASQPQLKHQGNGDEASTITELARVVTDTGAPNADTILNGIAA